MHCPFRRLTVIASRRRSNLPVDGCTAGLLHCVRNDGAGMRKGRALPETEVVSKPTAPLRTAGEAIQPYSCSAARLLRSVHDDRGALHRMVEFYEE